MLSVQNNKCLLATCNLNQWALDFDGNLSRIIESIKIAKSFGAKYRLGPELEICGYSCEDHFLEIDTFMHCDQSLAAILEGDLTDDILCDIGCPILHNNVRYNCRVICLNRKIIHIRPKLYLADDGNYREKRYFTAWDSGEKKLQNHMLSDLLRKITGQTTVPMGLGVIATEETTIASEICEELWTAKSPHINMYLSGVEIITNGSASHHELRKLDSRLSLIRGATRKCGGAYVYSNHRGCDGNRLYFDGSSLICVNGELVTQASQFSLNDVEVVTAVIDLETIRSFRGVAASLQEQSSKEQPLPVINLRHFSLRTSKTVLASHPVMETMPITARIHSPEEECYLGPACWLWDYLRRSGAAGFLLPLSGGADSSSVAAIVRVMCVLVAQASMAGNAQVIEDVHRIFSNNNTKSAMFDELRISSKQNSPRLLTGQEAAVMLQSMSTDVKNSESRLNRLANELTFQILHTIYLGTVNSSSSTQDRAKRLASSIHSYHSVLLFDDVVKALLTVFTRLTGRTPQFLCQGGTHTEDLALQNIQARLRMVLSYFCAQLFPWLRGNQGYLLVLGSANVDEALRGYMTKYDCSSADINPIGGMSKGDLKKMLLWLSDHFGLDVLREIASAAPTAELRPIDAKADTSESTQTDEEDMGMTYKELGVFGYLRKILRCGPVKMFLRLLEIWKTLAAEEIAAKVKRFFTFYAINRHKLTTLTPAYHAESYSPDDNRYDLRQFLYNTRWPRQFNTIDSILSSSNNAAPAASTAVAPALSKAPSKIPTAKAAEVPAVRSMDSVEASIIKDLAPSAASAKMDDEDTDFETGRALPAKKEERAFEQQQQALEQEEEGEDNDDMFQSTPRIEA